MNRGFTLIEMIVSVALFAIVMLVCVGALLALVAANRKGQALQAVVNNLNIAVDGMVRQARGGTQYDGSVGCPSPSGKDCAVGTTEFSFVSYNTQRITYRFVAPSGSSSGYLARSIEGGPFIRLTDDAVSITELKFFVVGATAGDTNQPQVAVVIKGSAGGTAAKIKTTFHIQATAVQRVLDI